MLCEIIEIYAQKESRFLIFRKTEFANIFTILNSSIDIVVLLPTNL